MKILEMGAKCCGVVQDKEGLNFAFVRGALGSPPFASAERLENPWMGALEAGGLCPGDPQPCRISKRNAALGCSQKDSQPRIWDPRVDLLGLSAPAGHRNPVRNVGALWPEPSERGAEGAQGLTAGTGSKTNERTEGETFLMIVNSRNSK